jgi:hypothetical protein
MNAAVIAEGNGSGALIPVALSASEIAPKGINNRPIESLQLPIRLGNDTQKRKPSRSRVLGKRLKELRSELRSIVRKYMAEWPIIEHPVLTKLLDDDKCCRSPKRHRTGEFGERIRPHE